MDTCLRLTTYMFVSYLIKWSGAFDGRFVQLSAQAIAICCVPKTKALTSHNSDAYAIQDSFPIKTVALLPLEVFFIRYPMVCRLIDSIVY